jgi:predicted alpha/beta hydrolase family esterase
MPNEDEPDYATWSVQIAHELAEMPAGSVVVGHSLGGSVLIKWLVDLRKKISLGPVFLISAPFWDEQSEWIWRDVELPPDAKDRLPRDLTLFIYHGAADDLIAPEHAKLYARLLPRATLRLLPGRDHQLNDDLSEIAEEILRRRR